MSDTNSTELTYVRQTGFKQGLPASPDFRILERSSINSFGNSVTKSEPTRISRNRNARKKRVTAVDSGVEVESPLDFDGLHEFGEGFTYSKAKGGVYWDISDALSNSIGVTDATLGADKVATLVNGSSGNSLLVTKGLKNTSKDTVLLLTTTLSGTGTRIVISGANEEVIPANRRARVYVAGLRGASGDLEIDADGNLISTVLDFTALGLEVDQAIYIGGPDASNKFDEDANQGFAQILEISANKLTLYNRDQDYVLDDGDGVRVDILYGPYLRNYSISDDNFQRIFYTFGLSSEINDTTYYEYAEDNACDSLSFGILEEFCTMTLGFVGSTTTKPSETAVSGHSDAAPLNATAEFASSVDLIQIGIKDIDGSNLLTDFDDLTLTITNGISARKVGGAVSPSQLNLGKFRVTFDGTAIFSNPEIIERIQCDRELNLRFPLWNDDGGLYFHIPKMGLEGGDRSFPENESVTISTTGYAYNDDIDGSSVNISLFPLLPKRPCAI